MQYDEDVKAVQTVSMVNQTLRPKLEQKKKALEEKLARINRAIEILDENPKFTEFLAAVSAATNF